MIRYLISIGAAVLGCAAVPLAAQTLHTSATELIDNTPATPGIVISKAVLVPAVVKGKTVIFCGRQGALWAYAVLPGACPVADPTAIAAPIITKAMEPGKSTAKAPRRTDLHMGRALDAFVLDGAGVAINDVRVDLSRYGVTMRRGDGSYGTVAGLTIRRVAITAGEAPVYLRGASHDILIEDARLTCTGTSSGIPGGLKIGAKDAPANYNITLRRASVTGCISKGRVGYQQGDGIATERPDHDITIVDTISTDHGDGCLDLKSSATRLDNVTVARCNWGLRLWAQGTAGTIRVGVVRKAAIQIKPTTDWAIDRLYLPDAVPAQGDVFADGRGGRLTIAWCSRPIKVTGGKSVVIRGTGCGL